jgi:hypothetical protein
MRKESIMTDYFLFFRFIASTNPLNTRKSTMTKFFVTVLLFIIFAGTGFVNAQNVMLSMDVLPTIPSYRTKWMDASIYERTRLAEDIGEAGAKRFAATKGWVSILEQSDKGIQQGFDQVYRSSDGMVHVVEAKGGTSPIGTGYGHPQGTSEWAVGAAKATLKNHAVTETEKQAAQVVIEAAAKGKLNVHVIRTPHVLGEAGIPILKSMEKTSPEAIRLAKEFISSTNTPVIRSVATAPKSNVTSTVVNSADDVARTATVLGKTAKVVSTVAVPVTVAVEVGTRGYTSYRTEQDYADGKIDNHQRVENHAENVGGSVGGVTGAVAGAEVGAIVGASVGSVVPVVGNVVGGIVGGVVGGIGGYFGGDWAGSKAGKTAVGWFW